MTEEFIELNLGKDGRLDSAATDLLIDIIDRALSLISDVAVGNERLKTTPEFREQLTSLRKAICGQGNPSGSSIRSMAESCLKACENFFSRAREHALNREIEFIEIIDVLRETVRTLAGQARDLDENLLGSSRRLTNLLNINDIQVLKHQIKVEVQDLQKIVEEKQKLDRENHSQLSNKIENLQARLERAEEDAMLDALTQVANRGSFDETIRAWVDSSEMGSRQFVLAMVDLDDFKGVNDQFGHQVGDRVLLGAAQMLGKSVRSGDFIARYGGEEFAILLRNCDLQQAQERFVDILAEIARTRYEYGSGESAGYVRFTASCGIAEFSEGDTAPDLIQRADEGLLEAKKNGKNRVVVKKKSRLRGFFRGRKNTAA